MGFLKHEPTLEELEEQRQNLEVDEENWHHRAQIAKLKKQIDAQGGKGLFSKIVGDSKGKNAISKAWSWLRNH